MRSAKRQRYRSLDKVFRHLATAIALVLISISWSAGPVRAGVPVSLKGNGSPAFQADLPVFFDPGGPRLDLAVVVYHPDLSFEERPGGGYIAQAVLRVKLARSGEVGLEAEEPYVIEVDEYRQTLDPTRFALLELSRPVEPGTWAVTITLEDPLAPGQGLGEARSRAEGVLQVPLPPPEGVYPSDLEFRWSAPGGEELPNPERIYGITQDSLIVYFELNRAPQGRIPYRIRIEDSYVGYSQEDTLYVDGGADRVAVSYKMPVGSFLEGAYTLRLAPMEPGGVSREGDFLVSWSVEHLVQTGRNVEMEIELLFDGDDRERLLAMPRPAQISALDSFWESQDPTPGTAANETYEIFLSRVEYARRQFRDQAHPGPLSPRGRIYIRYGPPAEVQVDVIPNDPAELEDAIVRVHDQGQIERTGTMLKQVLPRRNTLESYQDLQRFTPGSSGEHSAFELWIYDMDGKPLFDEGPVWPEEVNLRFLFVDLLGTGLYQLEFSNYPFRKD